VLRAVCAALLATFLAAPAPAAAEVKGYYDFSGGLNTRNAGILLQDNESPSLQNVIIDKNGGVSRRQGFTKVNNTAIGDGSTDANATYQLEQSDGDKYCVSFSSTSGYYSTDGCATNTVFVSTLTRNNDVSCDAADDNLICVNNQYNFYFDGTHDRTIASAPANLNYIRFWRNRCFGAGNDTNPSRLYWSNLADCTTWTTSTDYVDLDAEDGDIITGIGYDLFNFLLVCKNRSSYLIQFDNANPSNRKVINLSKNTGCKNHRAISVFDNRQYFASIGPYGGQPGIYSTDGIKIFEDSIKLRGSVDQWANFFANTGRKTIDTKADFDAGTFDSLAMSSARDPGFMQSSNTVQTDTLGADFGAGTMVNVSTTDVSGSLTLSSHTFTDNGCTNGEPAVHGQWTTASGVNPWVCSGGTMRPGQAGGGDMSADSQVSTGSWTFRANLNLGGGDVVLSVYLMLDGMATLNGYVIRVVSNASGQTANVSLHRVDSGSLTSLAQSASYSNTGNFTYNITRTQAGLWDIKVDGDSKAAATDTTYTYSSKTRLVSNTNNVSIDSFRFYGYRDNGSLVSRTFDTYISTPIWGLFAVNFSSNSEATATFQVQSSTANDGGGFETLVSQTPAIEMGAAQRRYWRYKISYATTVSTKTAQVNSVESQASSTGTWQSSEQFLSNSISDGGMGIFATNQTTSGSEAAISYCIRISTFSGGTPYRPCVSVTPGASISHATGAYAVVFATVTVGVATETAKIDAITINWLEGSSAKAPTMAVFKNRLHVCGQSAAGSINDECYVRDAKGSWVKWTGLAARHLNVVGQNFLMAASSTTSGGFIYKLYDTDSDNGASINSFWESKDLSLGQIENIKAVDRVFVLGSNDATTLTTTLKADSGSRSRSFDINLSTGTSFRIINKNMTGNPMNGNTFRLRFENNAASKPWSIFGFGLSFANNGLMQP
jgi:hypothetical protein